MLLDGPNITDRMHRLGAARFWRGPVGRCRSRPGGSSQRGRLGRRNAVARGPSCMLIGPVKWKLGICLDVVTLFIITWLRIPLGRSWWQEITRTKTLFAPRPRVTPSACGRGRSCEAERGQFPSRDTAKPKLKSYRQRKKTFSWCTVESNKKFPMLSRNCFSTILPITFIYDERGLSDSGFRALLQRV